MRTYIKTTTVGLFIALALARSEGAQTNLVQTITISGVTVAQGPSITNGTLVTTDVSSQRLANSDVIKVLGDATTNSFSSSARLLLITPLVPPDVSTIAIKDGTNLVDVTSFFVFNIISDTMQQSRLDTSSGRTLGFSFDIQRLRLRDRGGFPNLTLHFNMEGPTTTKFKSIVDGQGNVIGQANQSFATIAGDGDRDGSNIVERATLKVSGAFIEVLP